jgi:hypothetical protein
MTSPVARYRGIMAPVRLPAEAMNRLDHGDR